MSSGHPVHLGLEQPPVWLFAMWGLAARAQSHPTLGASALAAPHQFESTRSLEPFSSHADWTAKGCGP
jgi:hypothetical protein